MVIPASKAARAPLLAALVIASACAPSASEQPELPKGDGYDFFVLSLSWSPSYCAAEGPDANRQQCASGRDYAFVVHGLWPQFESGWPEFCDNPEPARVPDEMVRQMLDTMPSAGLIGHQWRKHGSCAGMSQRDYFAVVRAARERIEVPSRFARSAQRVELEPDDVETDFVATNPGLPEDGIAVTCDGRFLREVRICLTKDLEFRSCKEVDARSCQMSRALMPAPGG